ncbi:MAG: AMP nucleosidase [Acidobacteria bacterium]|nr:AMP nucleosidase [Acidobacteriota bacterium]
MSTPRSATPPEPGAIRQRVADACDALEQIDRGGCYARITVHRSWSRHNPATTGQIARPSAYRWYLERELAALLEQGAEIEIAPSRERIRLDDPELFRRIDESELDITRKKLFLFGPERVDLSVERLEHYTGTRAADFQRYVLLTNYDMHMAEFESVYPECVKPARPGVQMPAMHHLAPGNAGVSIVNIGVGPSNAKNLTDHVAVLRPDVALMIGHCAGVRNHQEIGDFVLASGYLRADRILDEALPVGVPIAPNFLLNRFLAQELDQRKLPYRLGVVYTTLDRNWELSLGGSLQGLRLSRAVAVDMESATVAANGFRFRIPHATLLCVSDKPLHGAPKLPGKAREFYEQSKRQHIAIALSAVEQVRKGFPRGLPNSDLRAMDEPLIR